MTRQREPFAGPISLYHVGCAMYPPCIQSGVMVFPVMSEESHVVQ